MRKLLTVITSVILCMTMLVIGPAQLVASAAASDKPEYISEIKVGMGQTSDEAVKELLEEGYTILTKEDGSYADLNENAGSKSALKAGPNQKIVYLGYKTTSDATDAITDLAVMNMEGGYSFQEYEILMDTQMETQVKPFVERFIATLVEYRENLQKPTDSLNYKRANYYRNLLNKLTDDDTDGKPLGDLLVNKTKYELGDEAYDALSDDEKKNHCDILTLLMQGNGQAVLMMETMLAKSSDSMDDTWLDRFLPSDPDSLYNTMKRKNPTMTRSEINAELDKKYYDTARKIADKWSAFGEVLARYDESFEKATAVSEVDAEALGETIDSVGENASEDAAVSALEAESTMVESGVAAEDVVVWEYLNATEYGDSTLFDFFDRDVSELSSEEGIRELYPMVDALSAGQIAALDFLSIKDMILMAYADENGFDSVNTDNMEPASIYEGVNREIYERGGVALTNDALRAKANAQSQSTSFELSTLGIVLWGCTAVAGAVAMGTAIADAAMKASEIGKASQKLADAQKHLSNIQAQLKKIAETGINKQYQVTLTHVEQANINNVNDLTAKLEKTTQEVASKSSVCKYLAVGFTVAMVILSVVSIIQTVSELIEYYNVDFAPIPKYIVDEVDITATNEKGEKVMIQNQTAYYKAVLCNRTAGDTDIEKKNYEILLDRNDLNGDVGKQWLALYSVKYENGTPILADSLKFVNGSSELPDGYTAGVHRFGEKGAFNLTSKYYCYNDPNNGTYVFFKNAASTVKDIAATTGSMFSGGSLAIGAAGGLIIGFVVALMITKATKKKEEQLA
jgi:hypothetical protein